MSSENDETLYERLGGYDNIAGFVSHLMTKVKADPKLGRFWRYRGADGLKREEKLGADFISSLAGGPVMYTGRDLKTAHAGMPIEREDWELLVKYTVETIEDLEVPEREGKDILNVIVGAQKEDVLEHNLELGG